MTRSKKNWDHLVDYYGNYVIEFDEDGNIAGVQEKQLPMMFIDSHYFSYQDPATDIYNNKYTGPLGGEVWGYRTKTGTPEKNIQSWNRVKFQKSRVLTPESLITTTNEEENRKYEVLKQDGTILMKGEIWSMDVEGDWVRVELGTEYYRQSYQLPEGGLYVYFNIR